MLALHGDGSVRTTLARLASALWIAAFLALVPVDVRAEVFIWIGPSGGSYGDLANWLMVDAQGAAVPATRLPGASDAIGFNDAVGAPVQIQLDRSTAGLQVLSGGPTLELANGSTLAIAGTLAVYPGTDADTPALTFTGTGSVQSTGGVPGSGIVVSNGGSLTFQGSQLSVESDFAAVGVETPKDPSGFPGDNGALDRAVVDGASWVNTHRLDVGGSASGELIVRNGGRIDDLRRATSEGLFLGSAVSTTGTLAIETGGSVASRDVIVGGAGSGEVTIESGGSLTTDQLRVGAAGYGGNGSLVLRDATSSLEVTGRMRIGDATGSGSFSMEGGTATVGELLAGAGANSALGFTGGQLTVEGGMWVDNGAAFSVGDGSGSTAELVLHSERYFSTFWFEDGLAIESDGIVRFDGTAKWGGGTWGNLYASELIDHGGQFDWVAGDLRVGSDLTVGTGQLLGDDLTLTPFGRSSLGVDGQLTIDGGSVALAGIGARLVADRVQTMNGGTLDLQQGELWLTGTDPGDGLVVGVGGLLGTNLTLDDFQVVDVATTTRVEQGSLLTLSGGSLRTGVLDLGGDASRLSWTSGSLSVDDLTVGSSGVLGAGLTLGAGQALTPGELTVTDGLLTVAGGRLDLGTHTIDTASGGELRFESGDLLADVAVQVGGDGGLTGTAGGATVSLGAGDDWSVAEVSLDGGVLALQGGRLVADRIQQTPASGAAFHFDDGQLVLTDTSQLVVGTGGMLGAGGSSTVALGAGDELELWSAYGGTGSLQVSDATLAMDQGSLLRAGTLTVDTSSGGELQYAGGDLRLDAGGLAIGDGGIVGAGGSSTVDVGTGSEIVAGGDTTITQGHTLALAGGELETGTLSTEPGGSFDFTSGTLTLHDDLYIGSSYAGTSASGTVLLSNTAGDPLASHYYELHDGMHVVVGSQSETFVDASGLLIESGASLETWDLSLQSRSHIDIASGGDLQVNHLDVSGPTSLSGTVKAQQVDVGAQLTLQPGALLIGKVIVNAGGTVGGVGGVQGDVVNGASVAPGQSPGMLVVDGNYEQLDAASLDIELGKDASTGQIVHDVLEVSGTVSLDGDLDVQLDLLTAGLDPTFDPVGEAVDAIFLTGAKIVGAFDAVLNRDLGDGFSWLLTYTNTAVALSVTDSFSGDIDLRTAAPVPEPGIALLGGASLLAFGARRRSRRPAG